MGLKSFHYSMNIYYMIIVSFGCSLQNNVVKCSLLSDIMIYYYKGGDNLSNEKNPERYELFSRLLSELPMVFYVLDNDWTFLLSDGQGLEKLGLKPGQVVGVSAKEMYRDHPDIIEAIERAFQGNKVKYTHKLGDTYLENYVAPYYNKKGEIDGIVGGTIDITERRDSELALERSRALQEAIMESVPGMIYMYDEAGELIYWNKSHETMTGYTKEELYRRTLMDWYKDDPVSQAAVIKGLENTAKGGFGEAEANLQCKDGSTIPLYLTACPLKLNDKDYFVGMGVDISTRIKAEAKLVELNQSLEQKVTERTQQLNTANEDLLAANEELTAMNEEMLAINEELTASNDQLITMKNFLVESEKMAALGGLVAGVAHEVNTPIGVGLTAASHLADISKELLALHETRLLSAEDIVPFLEDIGKASHIIYKNLSRAAHLIQSFKQLSVDQSTEPKREFDIGAYIDEVLVSLSPSLKKTQISITTDCPEKITIHGYPGSIAQIITNLVMNSLKHAYHPGDVGHIHIETTRTGSMVQIEYSDDGCGIDEQTIGRIFEPFFTTNRSGGGTGLGLSIIYTIVTQQYEGSIKCKSKPGEGTVFTIKIKGDAK